MLNLPPEKRFLLIVFGLLLVAAIAMVAGLQVYEKMRNFYSLNGVTEAVKKEHPGVTSLASTALALRLGSPDPARPMLLVDCRAPEEFRVSHLRGAVNLRSAAEVLKARDELQAARPKAADAAAVLPPVEIYVYCSVGHRSAALVKDLIAAGCDDGRYLRGGLFFWAREDRPVVDAQGQLTKKLHPFEPPWMALVDPANRVETP